LTKRFNLIIPNGFEANFTVGFVKGLVANGVDLFVLSCDETGSRLTAAGVDHLNIRGSLNERRPLAQKAINLLRYYARAVQQLVIHRNRTVHFTGMLDNRRILVEAALLLVFAKLTARRYIYTVHNVLPHGRAQSRWFRFLYQCIYRLPDVLVVHAETVRRQLVVEFGVSEAKIRVSSIGLNEEIPITTLSPSAARARLGFDGQEKVILFFGKIEEYKGADMLVSAFDRLPLDHSHLIFAGSFGDPDFRKQFLQQVSAAKRRRQIHLYEKFFDNAEIEVFFKASDVLCLPYRNIYQSGLMFLGARFGVPIVATDVGSLRDFLSQGFGTVTPSNAVSGICEALSEFFARPPISSRVEIATRARQFSWERICERLVPLYDSPVTRPAGDYQLERGVMAADA
jgi:glycosyltransferase involved in cell wall biosynthesis